MKNEEQTTSNATHNNIDAFTGEKSIPREKNP